MKRVGNTGQVLWVPDRRIGMSRLLQSQIGGEIHKNQVCILFCTARIWRARIQESVPGEEKRCDWSGKQFKGERIKSKAHWEIISSWSWWCRALFLRLPWVR